MEIVEELVEIWPNEVCDNVTYIVEDDFDCLQ